MTILKGTKAYYEDLLHCKTTSNIEIGIYHRVKFIGKLRGNLMCGSTQASLVLTNSQTRRNLGVDFNFTW